MKKILLVALIGAICLTTAACSEISQNSSVTIGDTTMQATEKTEIETKTITEKTTEPITKAAEKEIESKTEKPTAIDTDPNLHEYTAVEIADKSLYEIIEIMGGDFDVDNGQKYLIHYTSGPARNIYNNKTLPGFVFFVEPKEGILYDELAEDTDFDGIKSDVLAGKLKINFIGLFRNAKYDENISVGMKYLDISKAMDNYSLTPPAGSEAMRQKIKYSDKESPTAMVYYRASGDDEEKARQENPESWGIVVFPDK